MDNKPTILIVDDDPKFRKTLSDILRAKGYAPLAAAKGKTALNRVKKERPAVALIDLKLPDMDGLEVMREIKKRSPSTECIVLTGYGSQASAIEAVNLGAYGYMQKPYDVEQLVLTIRRAIEKRQAAEALRESEERYRHLVELSPDAIAVHSEGKLVFINTAGVKLAGASSLSDLIGKPIMDFVHPDYREIIQERMQQMRESGKAAPLIEEKFIRLDGQVIIVELAAMPITYRGKPAVQVVFRDITERKRAEEALKSAALETVEAVSRIVEANDPYAAGHSAGVTEIAIKIAQEMGLMNSQLDTLRIAGPLHDVGKVGIPSSVLNKPTGLTQAEWVMIQSHPVASAQMSEQVTAFREALPAIRHHHERWDGTGYPEGLKGDDISLLARILAVADGFQAMTSERPYRRARTEEEALAELEKGAGTQWDPGVVKVLLKLRRPPTRRKGKAKRKSRK